MNIKKRKIKWRNIIILIIIIICVFFFTISIIDIIKWKIDSDKTQKQIKDIQDIVEIEEVVETEESEIEIIEQEDKSNPYWDYINVNLINVDFNNLKKINSNTKGWIKVNGTNINYPFVQTTNNKYYLTHSYDNSYNSAGWIFLDYRNDINSLSKNTVIYGHGRLDKTMFGSLKNILTSGWLNNKENYIIKLSTEEENTMWQVFSVYHIPTTSDYIKVDFDTEDEFISFVNMLINRSAYDFETIVGGNDNILTLSTCYNDTEKVVLHAKLIKRDKK